MIEIHHVNEQPIMPQSPYDLLPGELPDAAYLRCELQMFRQFPALSAAVPRGLQLSEFCPHDIAREVSHRQEWGLPHADLDEAAAVGLTHIVTLTRDDGRDPGGCIAINEDGTRSAFISRPTKVDS